MRLFDRRVVSVMFVLLAGGTVRAGEVGPVRIYAADRDGTLHVRMTAATGKATIGGYRVPDNDSLTVCDEAGRNCADPYVGAVLALKPGQRLVMDLRNALANEIGTPEECMSMDGKPGLLNLHTHGLLVPPYARTGAAPPVFGDTVFHCVLKGASGGPVVADTMRYDIRLAELSPGVPHPLGIDWVHPHVHGLARAQVSSGMTSMITVGDVNDLLCARPAPGGGAAAKNCVHIPPERVKHLMLKDAQLYQLGSEKPADRIWHNLSMQDADFCGQHKFDSANFGECVLDPDAVDPNAFGGKAVRDGRWVFTINGQKNPHWDVGAGRYEIWRIQNASANVTYRLGLHASTVGADVASRAPFQVLDMDGAGLASVTGDGKLPTTGEILLMPSSRADLLVQAPRENARDVTYALDTDNFQAGFAAGDADIWPHIRLASVTFRAQRNYLDATARPLPFAPQALVAAAGSVDAGKLAKGLEENCAGFDEAGLTAAQKQFYADHLHVAAPWKRRVYFGVPGDVFVLGTTIVDPAGQETDLFGRPITDEHPVTLEPYTQMGAHTRLCVLRDAGEESWQLVNVSNEVHNFHIHQLKFRIVRRDGLPVMRAPSPIDRVMLPNALLFKTGTTELKHDVVVVPRGSSVPIDPTHQSCSNSIAIDPETKVLRLMRRASDGNECDGTLSTTDLSGSIEVAMTFDGSQFAAQDDGSGTKQHAKFVFHCHILEHEDKGMMAGITVIDPAVYR